MAKIVTFKYVWSQQNVDLYKKFILIQMTTSDPWVKAPLTTHVQFNDYTTIYPDYADGWYIRKAKVEPGNNARDMLLDWKMRRIALEGQRDTEKGLYLPLKTGYKPIDRDRPEYKTHKPKHQHLYSKYR